MKPTVFVIDDDPGPRQSLRRLVASVDLHVETFSCPTEFLNVFSGQHGCVVTDVRMPGMSGLELQRTLKDAGYDIPIIFMTAYADVPMAVASIKAGAVDLLEKPCRPQTLLEQINHAIERDKLRREQRQRHQAVRDGLSRLTPRERQVLERVIAGMTSRAIAESFGLSPKTIHVHRAEIMSKLNVDSVADLVRIVSLVEPELAMAAAQRAP